MRGIINNINNINSKKCFLSLLLNLNIYKKMSIVERDLISTTLIENMKKKKFKERNS